MLTFPFCMFGNLRPSWKIVRNFWELFWPARKSRYFFSEMRLPSLSLRAKYAASVLIDQVGVAFWGPSEDLFSFPVHLHTFLPGLTEANRGQPWLTLVNLECGDWVEVLTGAWNPDKRKAKLKSCSASPSSLRWEVTLSAQKRRETHTHTAAALFRPFPWPLIVGSAMAKATLAPWPLLSNTRPRGRLYLSQQQGPLHGSRLCSATAATEKESVKLDGRNFACVKAHCGGSGLVQGGWMVVGRKRCCRGHAGGGGARKHTH